MARICILALVSLTVASAQSTAVISGTVEDSTGGLIPGAAVTAIQQQTDQHFDAISDSQGRFSFPRRRFRRPAFFSSLVSFGDLLSNCRLAGLKHRQHVVPGFRLINPYSACCSVRSLRAISITPLRPMLCSTLSA